MDKNDLLIGVYGLFLFSVFIVGIALLSFHFKCKELEFKENLTRDTVKVLFQEITKLKEK